MSVCVHYEARQEAPVTKTSENVFLRQRQVSNKVDFLLICVSEKLHFCEDMCLVKNGSNVYLGDDGVKELVKICDHVHFSHKNEWTKDCIIS